MKHSIQFRLQAWHGAILCLALAGFLWVFQRAAWEEELRRIDTELSQGFERVFASSGGDTAGPPPPGGPPGEVDDIRAKIASNIQRLESKRGNPAPDYFLFIDYDGTVFARSSNAPRNVPFPAGMQPEPRPTLIPGQGSTWGSRTRDGNREVYRVLPLNDAIVIGRNLDVERRRVLAQLAWVALAGAGLLWAGLVGGWWFTRRALSPIASIGRTAEEIASGDLSRRVPVDGSDGELDRLAGVLNGTFAKLESSFDRQARFTSDASHELRTPISVILSKTQMALQRERSPEEYRKALEVCRRAAERMRGLTESLLLLSRQDAALPIPREPTDLALIAADAAAFLKETAESRRIAIHLDLAPAALSGDSDGLAQVAVNLLTNAIQHAPDGSEVTVRTAASDIGVSLTVLDQGSGIAPENLPHVFDRFYRADASRSSAGYGLGLSIVHGIVAAHGGTATAANRPDGGAVFAVVLPVSPPRS